MIAFGFALIFVGFLALIFSMKRHYRQLREKREYLPEKQAAACRVFGFSCLFAGGTLCVLSEGVGVGLVYWAGLLTVAVLVQALLLSYRPRWLVKSVLIVLVTGTAIGGMNYAIY